MLNLELIGQGATTKVYRDGNMAIKLYLNAPPDEAENEAERQRFARSAGLPVPAVHGVRRLDGNAIALDMDFIDGTPLIQPRMDKDARNAAIQTLVRLQCAVHQVKAVGLPRQTSRLKWKISKARSLDEAQKDKLISLLESLDSGSDCLCHGDFHPHNILFDGAQHWIIDWVDATAGNPLADACRSYLIFKQFMSRSSGLYLKAFCKETNTNQSDVLAWLPVVAAARLSDKLDEKSCAWLTEIVQNGGGLK